MLYNCGIGEDSWESLGLQGDPPSPKGNQSWIFIESTDAEASILQPPNAKNWLIGKDPDAESRRRRGQKRTEWDGWMASPTWWTWVWASSGSWQWTGKPGMLHSMGSQRVGHNWATELNCIELNQKAENHRQHIQKCLWVAKVVHLSHLVDKRKSNVNSVKKMHFKDLAFHQNTV